MNQFTALRMTRPKAVLGHSHLYVTSVTIFSHTVDMHIEDLDTSETSCS